MAQWVSQSECRSVTGQLRRRTAYLAPLLDVVARAIEEYFQRTPEGEVVTLAVLREIGKVRLKQFSAGKSFSRAKQDVGLFVAQTLVDLYGTIRVNTLRRGNRKTVSTRRNTWPDLDWVDSFAPHQLLKPPKQSERIFLDTSIVREIVHGDKNSLDPEELESIKGEHPVSVADGAIAELATQLLRGAVSPGLWSFRIKAVDKVLDPDFPAAPGGKELAAFWGSHSPVGLDLDEARSYYRAVWSYLCDVQEPSDLSRDVVFHGPISGRAYTIKMDKDHVTAVLDAEGRRWSDWVVRMATAIKKARKQGGSVTEASLRDLFQNDLALDMGYSDALKLELVTQVMAKRAIQAVSRKTPYNPKGKSNDVLDLGLLFGIPLPGWVCTADDRLHRLVRSLDSRDKEKVMTATELVEHLREEARG